MGMRPIMSVLITSTAALADQKATCIQSASFLEAVVMRKEIVRT